MPCIGSLGVGNTAYTGSQDSTGYTNFKLCICIYIYVHIVSTIYLVALESEAGGKQQAQLHSELNEPWAADVSGAPCKGPKDHVQKKKKCPKQWTLYCLYCLLWDIGPLFWALSEVRVDRLVCIGVWNSGPYF